MFQDIDLLELEDYRTKSKRWRDDVCQVLLGRVCTSSAKFQDDLFNETAIPPVLINELGKENRRTNGGVEAYIYSRFTNKHGQLASALDYCLNSTKETFSVKQFKSSLKTRMDASKTFVLIVGDQTASVTAGSCRWCGSYNSYTYRCAKGYSVDYRSFIKFECDKAVEAGIKIIVLYKATRVDRSKCPEAVRYVGTHASMIYKGNDGNYYWDYQSVKDAFDA